MLEMNLLEIKKNDSKSYKTICLFVCWPINRRTCSWFNFDYLQAINDDPQTIQCNSIIGYNVNCIPNDKSSIRNVTTQSTTATINGLSACTIYECRVRVVNKGGFEGPWSEAKAATTNTTGKSINQLLFQINHIHIVQENKK